MKVLDEEFYNNYIHSLYDEDDRKQKVIDRLSRKIQRLKYNNKHLQQELNSFKLTSSYWFDKCMEAREEIGMLYNEKDL